MNVNRCKPAVEAAHAARTLFGDCSGLHDRIRGVGVRQTARCSGLSPMRVQRFLDRLGAEETFAGARVGDLARIAHSLGCEVHIVAR